jgi:hypothetical protein
MAVGRISDPFVGDEELRVQWVAEWNLARARKALRVRSVVDTYE